VAHAVLLAIFRLIRFAAAAGTFDFGIGS